jgi:adenosylcobyric acid synthase
VATYAQARVALVGDIDTGGIFAQLLGTLMLLEPEERALVRGLIVNRFRGDPALFADGVRILEQRSGLPVLGVVPWIEDLRVAEEDAVALERGSKIPDVGLTIAVVHLPAIANFDDFDPLAREPGVVVRYITRPDEMANAAAVILPGTKHTLAARRWLRERGFDTALRQFPGAIVGICGGYQLLGEWISDPAGVEGQGGEEPGLGALPVETVFSSEKRTVRISAQAHAPWASSGLLEGYEIHMGRTRAIREERPLLTIVCRSSQPTHESDGHISADGRIWGCYMHGIFANDEFRRAWLRSLGWYSTGAPAPPTDPYDHLARHVAAALGEGVVGRLLQAPPAPVQ